MPNELRARLGRNAENLQTRHQDRFIALGLDPRQHAGGIRRVSSGQNDRYASIVKQAA